MLIASFLRRFWFWLRRRHLDAGFEEEVRQHLELKVQENIRRGMSAEEASRQAHLEFGNPALAKEHSRQSWGFPSLESVWQDLRYAGRQLRKNPGFTAVAVITLSLGIGANAAMFSFINAFLLSSLPVKNPHELVHLRNTPHGGFDQQSYEYLRDHNHTLAGIIALDDGHITMSVDREASVLEVNFVSANFYSLLEVPAYRGRMLSQEDDIPGRPAVVVISYGYWQRRFGMDSSVIGKTVQFKDVSCTIVGVSPPGFYGLRVTGPGVPITIPAQWRPQLGLKDHTTVDLTARLAKGVDMKQAQADLDLVYHQELQAEAGELSDPGRQRNLLERRIAVLPAQGPQAYEERFTLQLNLLQAVVGLVLLIACVNLANLLLARGNARYREIGVRLALGARRGRIIRQLMTENLLLALLGGALGLLLCTQLMHLLLFLLAGTSDTGAIGIHLDRRVLIFTVSLSVLTGLIFGLLPALRTSRGPVANSLRLEEMSSDGKPVRASRLLVVPQIAISLVVLILAGLLLRSLQHLQAVDLGFQHDHLLTFWLMPTLSGYDGERELRLYDDVLAALNGLPGVRVASLSRLSLLRRGRSQGLKIDGGIQPDAAYTVAPVAPRLFETLHLPILAGRDFLPQDSLASLPVAVINEAGARKYFGGENPLGHRIALLDREPGIERTIVGVVRNMKFSFRNDMPAEAVYIPYAQSPVAYRGQAMIKVSTAVDPESMIPAIRQQVHAVAKDLPVIDSIFKEDDVLDGESNGQERSLSRLLGSFAALAVGLALLGLYGTVTYSVSRRIREIAIRMALGAQHANVLWMIVSESLRVVLLGAAIGAGLAVAASRTLEGFLFGVKGFDPPTYLFLIAAFIGAASIAAYLPARRAVRVDPVIALRHE